MNIPDKKSSLLLVGLVLLLIVFAFALLTYTRRVDGTSMLPTFREGDLVVIDKVPMSSIHVGDIIVYGAPCSAIVYDHQVASVIHRVVQNTSGGFLTKGDNNPDTDQREGIAKGAVTANCIEGKVFFVVPYVELLASLPGGLNYALAALLLLGVFLYELWGRKEKGPVTAEAQQAVETGRMNPSRTRLQGTRCVVPPKHQLRLP